MDHMDLWHADACDDIECTTACTICNLKLSLLMTACNGHVNMVEM
jgi:hypothetical protein